MNKDLADVLIALAIAVLSELRRAIAGEDVPPSRVEEIWTQSRTDLARAAARATRDDRDTIVD